MEETQYGALLGIVREAQQDKTSKAANHRFIRNCKTLGLSEPQILHLGGIIECWSKAKTALADI